VAELDSIRRHIEAHDRLIEQFGMEILDVQPGTARVAMTVAPRHLNAADLCHGAAIFALADVAFALACNSHGVKALALEVSINYLRPARAGDRLVARAQEMHLGRRTGLYTIAVTGAGDREIAFLKATAYRLDEHLVPKG